MKGEKRVIRVLLAFGNILFSVALKDLMDLNGCEYFVDIIYPLNGNLSGVCSNYDVIVSDYLSLSHIPRDFFGKGKVIIMELGLKKETIASLFLTENISGVIKGESDIHVLLKAIQSVHNGELWIDRHTVKTLLDVSTSRGVKNSADLTEREVALINVLKDGYRNKEIADILSISEQTVKSHLNRIFRKMNVSGRTELLKKLSEQQTAEVRSF